LALATALCPPLAADGSASLLDPALIDLAIQRHRIGPLLQAGALDRPVTTDSDANKRLGRHVAANAERTALAVLVQRRLVHRLSMSGIPALIFKGTALAQRLYGNPALRHCGDIDVLVPPERFSDAAEALCAAGYRPHAAAPSQTGAMSWPAARIIRDVGFRDDITGQRIELHQRFFRLNAWSVPLMAADPSLCPRMPAGQQDIPAPEIGPALACYLLLHGAFSAWRRLKWLADIHALLGKLSPDAGEKLAAMAENLGTAAGAKASLRLLQDVFATPLAPQLTDWLGEPAGQQAISRRLAFFRRHLNEPTETRPNPFNSKREMITAYVLATDKPLDRAAVLTQLLAGTSVRRLEKRLRGARRQA
jgi:hypothetical protein